jgi:flagellar protein FliS
MQTPEAKHPEKKLLAANRLKLVELLYCAALESIIAARQSLRLGDPRSRSQAIQKATEIVTELTFCLNHESDSDLSRNLAELYGYTQKMLMEANKRQSEPLLSEAERLLTALLDAWVSCSEAVQGSHNGHGTLPRKAVGRAQVITMQPSYAVKQAVRNGSRPNHSV